MKYQVPYFGELDLEQLEDYYEIEIEILGNNIQLDLNFDNAKVEMNKLHLICENLKNLDKLNNQNKIEIRSDFKKNGEVTHYIDNALESLNLKEQNDIINNISKSKSDEGFLSKTTLILRDLFVSKQSSKNTFLEAIKLKRIGFYPDVENAGIVSDYTLSREHLDELVVVFRKLDGTFDGISIES